VCLGLLRSPVAIQGRSCRQPRWLQLTRYSQFPQLNQNHPIQAAFTSA